ncbi:MAG: multisubunit Na+/H+ antiporter MnhB subunit [Paraglaciecola sp.]|jgi:multisubunit Na+/H+ antiporter MnhB subunit
MFNQIDLKYDGPVKDEKASLVIAGLSVAGVLFVLILILLNFVPHNSGLRPYVDGNMDISGVTNPVTAVLLNFRAYDTLLEVAVLLIVVIAVLPLNNHKAPLLQRTKGKSQDLVLIALQRWIAPVVLMFAGYLLWAGASQPGGAFQAGALMAGTCVLLFQTDTYQVNYTSAMARSLMAIGLAVFIAVGLALIWFEGNLLYYPQDHASLLILLIEGCATVSIALGLASLYSSLIDMSFVEPQFTHDAEKSAEE